VLGSAHGIVVDFAELSDAGRDPSKQINEDASGYAETPLGHLAVVCDGMGGHSAGREASQAAVRTILESARSAAAGSSPREMLRVAIEQANAAVYAVGGESAPELRPGSTCVAVLLYGGYADVAHTGDSRAYLIRGQLAERLSRDHSMVQQLVDSGMLSPEDALAHPEANKITRALGIAASVEVELRAEAVRLSAGDTLLLCSDGLTDLVPDAEIGSVVANRVSSGAASVCQELVKLANDRGGHDNITVLVLHVVEVSREDAGPTLVQRGAGGTLVTDSKPTVTDGPAPTVYDEPAPTTQPGVTAIDTGDRHTEPGISLGAAPRFTHDEPPQGFPTRPPRSRLWLMLVIGLALTVLGGLGTWGLVRWMHKSHSSDTVDETVPPPPSEPEPWRRRHHPWRSAPSAEIEPMVEPEVDAAPSASVPLDAEIPPNPDSGFP